MKSKESETKRRQSPLNVAGVISFKFFIDTTSLNGDVLINGGKISVQANDIKIRVSKLKQYVSKNFFLDVFCYTGKRQVLVYNYGSVIVFYAQIRSLLVLTNCTEKEKIRSSSVIMLKKIGHGRGISQSRVT